MIVEFILCLLLLSGSILMLLATIGLVRFKDTLCRLHALTKATTLGVSLLLAALMIKLDDDIANWKILLVIGFTLLTIPLASHLIASLYYRRLHSLDVKSDQSKPPANPSGH